MDGEEAFRLLPAGDRALVIEFGDAIDPRLAALAARLSVRLAHSRPAGLVESVPTYRSVVVHYDPLAADPVALREAVAEAARAVAAGKAGVAPWGAGARRPRLVEIPVTYGGEAGPDLPYVAARTGLAPAEVIRLHAAPTYLVHMLGFLPGFPYLGGLDRRLATPRLATPRLRVPAGSVGIGGEQTGIYPVASPGGWAIIGRTGFVLFDPTCAEPSLLAPGDRVRFVPAAKDEAAPAEAAASRPAAATGAETGPVQGPERPLLRVLQPGPRTTVQDLGRYGHQALGVPVAGTTDPWALRVLNRLVGNPDGAAGLEATVEGPTLVAEGAAGVLVAVGGAETDATADGVPVPPYRATWLPAGTRFCTGGARRGARPVLAVAGGIDVPIVLGSRSTSLWGGFGGHEGRPLAAGDRLAVGPVPDASSLPARDGLALPRHLSPPLPDAVILRVVLGPQADRFTDAALAALLGGTYRLTPDSDRMGARLEGPRLAHRGSADIVSDGTAAGSIQVPESGLPIVLLADRQTTGGYAKIATVVSADLPRLAQLVPGGAVRFEAVELAAAHAAAAEAEARLEEALAAFGPHPGPAPWGASARLLAANLVSGVVAAGEDP